VSGPLLAGEGLTIRYGGVVAVDGVDIEVAPGQLVGLIGPNGAGKTSLIDGISGFAPMSGRLMLDGQDIQGRRAHQRTRLGVARSWQSVELFEELTILENLQVAADRPSWAHVALDLVKLRPYRLPAAEQALERVGIADLAGAMPRDLSHGQQVLAGVARTLATGPRLALMDEPGAGLDHNESADLGRRLRALVADGLSILLVDHDMDLVLSSCDQIYVLDFGRLIAQGTPAEIRTDPTVVAAYLGEPAAEVSA